MEILLIVVAVVLAFALGMATYRFWLKRSPESLEALAKKAKESADRARAKL